MSTPTILIQSLIRRAGGSKISLHGKIYHFVPENAADPDAIHVCAVPKEDAAAIHRFRAIKEGFKILSDDSELPPKPAPAPVNTIALDKAAGTAPAPAAPEVKPIFLGDGESKVELTAMSREELADFAKREFKISVHHRWSDETLIQKILEHARGED